jgi:hypothetical protein
MEFDFGHTELLTNPVHLLTVHFRYVYGQTGHKSIYDTFLLTIYVPIGYCSPRKKQLSIPMGLLLRQLQEGENFSCPPLSAPCQSQEKAASELRHRQEEMASVLLLGFRGDRDPKSRRGKLAKPHEQPLSSAKETKEL